ncbi:MAG: zf-HC2 domain-containing protein [Planctomycetes bacterium]|nr:zf-HC2 domain-containing protein [Planctomycetota bacterium]
MSAWQAIKKVLTLRCHESSRILSEASDGELSFIDKLALRGHLLVCGPCRKYQKQLRKLRSLIENAMKSLESEESLFKSRLSDDVKAKMQAIIDSHNS